MSEKHATPEEAVAASRWAGSAEAQVKAAQTPQTVRRAMLAGPRTVHGVTLYPLSLDTLWTLEAINHKVGTPSAEDKGELTLSHLEIAQMIYAFAAPGAALELASMVEEDSGAKLTTYDLTALKFVRDNALFPHLAELGAVVAAMISEGLAAAPGDGNPTVAAPQ